MSMSIASVICERNAEMFISFVTAEKRKDLSAFQ